MAKSFSRFPSNSKQIAPSLLATSGPRIGKGVEKRTPKMVPHTKPKYRHQYTAENNEE